MTGDDEAGEAYESALSALLEEAIRDELRHISTIGVLPTALDGVLEISEAVLHQLASAVASRIEYAFSVRWDPSWVEPGEPHVWSTGAAHFARCNACLVESGAMETEAAVKKWHREHQATVHGDSVSPGGA